MDEHALHCLMKSDNIQMIFKTAYSFLMNYYSARTFYSCRLNYKLFFNLFDYISIHFFLLIRLKNANVSSSLYKLRCIDALKTFIGIQKCFYTCDST